MIKAHKKKGIFLIILFLCSVYTIYFTQLIYPFLSSFRPHHINTLSIPSLIWNVTWGGLNYDEGAYVALDSTGIYVVGRTESFGAESANVLLAKYDINSNLLWNITWGGPGFDVGKSVVTNPNGIYVIGYTNSFGAASYDVLLAKYDISGEIIWNITWGGKNFDLGSSIAIRSNDIYLTGYTNSFGMGGYDVFLANYNNSGGLLWNITWGGLQADKGESVIIGSDSIYVAGYTNSIVLWDDNAFLAEFDLSGNLIWNVTWGGLGYEYGNGIAIGLDGIYLTGVTDSFGMGNDDVFLVKYDISGKLIWNVTWGGLGDDYGDSIAISSDGIYLTGSTNSFGMGDHNAFLAKFDFSGNLIWNVTWGGQGDDGGNGIAVSSNGIYITGETNSFGATDYDVFLAKYNFSSGVHLNGKTPNLLWIWLTVTPIIPIILIVIIYIRKKKEKTLKPSPLIEKKLNLNKFSELIS